MKFTLEVALGNSKLIVEQECDGIKGLFKEAGIFSTFPKECNNCKSGELALNERKTSKGEYYEITCQECGHRKQYGQSKDNVTLYPKEWEAPYSAEGEEPTTSDKKSGGKSALQKAKEAKSRQAAKPEDEEEYSNSTAEAEEEEVEEKVEPKKKSRSDILAKFGKKKATQAEASNG